MDIQKDSCCEDNGLDALNILTTLGSIVDIIGSTHVFT